MKYGVKTKKQSADTRDKHAHPLPAFAAYERALAVRQGPFQAQECAVITKDSVNIYVCRCVYVCVHFGLPKLPALRHQGVREVVLSARKVEVLT